MTENTPKPPTAPSIFPGQLVRAFDFPTNGKWAWRESDAGCYMEGVVVAVVKRSAHSAEDAEQNDTGPGFPIPSDDGKVARFFDCDRYAIRVLRRVWEGKDETAAWMEANPVSFCFPPVNGTPTTMANTTDGVWPVYRDGGTEIERHLGIPGRHEEPPAAWICEECGSERVQVKGWIQSNGQSLVGPFGEDKGERWCEDCEAHTGQLDATPENRQKVADKLVQEAEARAEAANAVERALEALEAHGEKVCAAMRTEIAALLVSMDLTFGRPVQMTGRYGLDTIVRTGPQDSGGWSPLAPCVVWREAMGEIPDYDSHGPVGWKFWEQLTDRMEARFPGAVCESVNAAIFTCWTDEGLELANDVRTARAAAEAVAA